ncbi:ChaN family lipoprotein [Halomonas rhizosphaerae]|uniref:ChaN family lipoprotein n=1 Tax=Halomonas rhizosphaerae TaxID=3043296 RepID=A0ABT6V299_9GAMM|nr:ChaN family lipoprotein [Halomonas rhizosphaerae]MDI5892348.1 ChaN family lipoprotein [Halomonas rhizosphaerae]
MSRSRSFPVRSLCVGTALAWLAPLAALADDCPVPGQWQVAGGETLTTTGLMAELAGTDVVLLGEQHDRLDHHRWQLHTLAALHAHRPEMVIGLEMLPREAQPALDAWVAGELDEAAFLEQSDWRRAWGFDPDLYLPILHFARMQRIPLLALNVTPELRGRLASEGWAAVPEQERFGITPPAPAQPAYRASLEAIYAEHADRDQDPANLERFIAAQLVWDRAMASALVDAAADGPLVAGLLGEGHLADGDGVPYQLDDLGLGNHRSLLPWAPGPDCQLPAAKADARYVLGDESAFQPPDPPRLGVLIGEHAEGVLVQGIAPESVAEAAGLAEGDVIVSAAGLPMAVPADLTAVIGRQAPGTLLPLEIRRDGERQEVLARFPPAAS